MFLIVTYPVWSTLDNIMIQSSILFQILAPQASSPQVSSSNSSQSQSSQTSSQLTASANHTQAVLNSLQQQLSAAGSASQNGITVQPNTTRIVTQTLNSANSLDSPLSPNGSILTSKFAEIGAAGQTNASNLANQILATKITSTQLLNHVPSSLEGLMPSKYSLQSSR